MSTDSYTRRHRLQMWAAMIVLIVGCALIVFGLVIPPMGEIHPTVLVAFGECLTFSGAVLGAKYYADFRAYIHHLLHTEGHYQPNQATHRNETN